VRLASEVSTSETSAPKSIWMGVASSSIEAVPSVATGELFTGKTVMETLVGVALILGAFTGIAAFFGVFMNASFLFAGTAGANPFMALVGVVLVLAWRVAGRWGLDRWILPATGVPGAAGTLFRNRGKGAGTQ
jgi:uncharacterized membrane protein YphA (DoxX/SURF4 family)